MYTIRTRDDRGCGTLLYCFSATLVYLQQHNLYSRELFALNYYHLLSLFHLYILHSIPFSMSTSSSQLLASVLAASFISANALWVPDNVKRAEESTKAESKKSENKQFMKHGLVTDDDLL